MHAPSPLRQLATLVLAALVIVGCEGGGGAADGRSDAAADAAEDTAAVPDASEQDLAAPPADAPESDDAAVTPTLGLRLSGVTGTVHGHVTVVVQAAPPEAFFGVELALGATRLGALEAPPFTFDFDSAAHPDGPAVLTATGVLAASGERLTATLEVELANRLPVVTVLAPLEGETVVGSPTSGFVVHPVVEALDGNGISGIEARSGGAFVDLGPGDGSVPVILEGLGRAFPHAPVPVEIRVRDGSGHEASVTVQVTPSPVVLTFDAATGYGASPTLDRVLLASDGRPALLVGRDLYVLPEATREAVPSLAVSATSPLLGADDTLYWLGPESPADYGVGSLWRAPFAEPTRLLLSLLLAEREAAKAGPLALSTGDVALAYSVGAEGWVTEDAHIAVFGPDGTLRCDVAHPAVVLTGSLAESTDGRLLALVGPAGVEAGRVQPFDAATGAALPAWPLATGLYPQAFRLVDATEVLVESQDQNQPGGPPPSRVTAHDPVDGHVRWELALAAGEGLALARRLADGEALLFRSSSSPGGHATLSVHGPTGASVLWESADLTWLKTELPGSGALVLEQMPSTLATLGADGTRGWSKALAGAYVVAGLPGGDVALVQQDGETARLEWSVIAPDGAARWSEALDGQRPLGVSVVAGQLVAGFYGSDAGVFVVEARDPSSGALLWHYSEGSAAEAWGGWAAHEDAPWGLVLAQVPLGGRLDPYGNPAGAVGVRGLLP